MSRWAMCTLCGTPHPPLRDMEEDDPLLVAHNVAKRAKPVVQIRDEHRVYVRGPIDDWLDEQVRRAQS